MIEVNQNAQSNAHHATAVLEKINDKTAVVAIVGVGYVGLPLVIRFLEVGFPVIGFDIDQSKVSALLKGESYIEHIDAGPIKTAADSKRFDATTDFSRMGEADAVILCVPTPLNKNREPDLSYVVKSVEALAPHLRAGQMLSLESTTYPGTTDEELLPRMEKQGFKVGEDLFLVYSPEREDPGNPNFSTREIPKVVGGMTPNCLEVGKTLYETVIDTVVPMSSPRAAELVKILENTYRAVNIALVNELKQVADKMDLDIFEIIRAAATKPFGFKPFYPGPGLGGHCIPIDPFYLTWKAREYNIATKFIELAGEINSDMPDYVISKVASALNDHCKPVKNAKILMLGVAYKKNVDDMRESPSLVLISALKQMGAEVSYSDPHVAEMPNLRNHNLNMQSVELTAESLAAYDCLVVATDHDRFDWDFIKQHARLIVDTRGVYVADGKKVYRA